MNRIVEMYRESAKELKSVRTLSMGAMLTAITVILGFFAIVIGDFVKIQFYFLTVGISGMLFGPVVSGIIGGLGDILSFIVKPTGTFFPGFTLNAIISGVIYGMFMYKKPVSFWRIFAAKLTITVIVEMGLSTYWLTILYGQGFWAILATRIIKCVVMLPIDSIMLYAVASRVGTVFCKQK